LDQRHFVVEPLVKTGPGRNDSALRLTDQD
jgi:hypothetical protein